jgi:hypothetical protein
MVRLLTNDLSSRRLRIGKLYTGFCLAILLITNGIAHAQSASFGSSYAYGGGITSIIGQHDFQTGSGTISQGIIGSERPTNSSYGFLQGASWLNANDNAFIDGYATTYGTGAFTFPIGDNGKYRPAAVSASTTAAPASAAYYGVDPTTAITSALQGGNEIALPTGAPFAITAKATGISSVTNKEYWDIKGSTAAKISLTWDATSAISTLTSAALTKLTIVGWNGTQWVRIPSTVDATSVIGGASSLTAGSITTDAAITPNTYTVYSFAAFAATFTFNCGTATSMGTFVANGTGGQTGSLTIPITGVTAGAATFTVAGTGFTGTLSTTLTGTETSVVIPITYDGTGAARSETLTVTSTEGVGTCTKAVTVGAALVSFNCGSAVNAPATVNGISITGSSTGSVGTFATAFSSCFGGASTPANSLHLGQTGVFTYTYTFSVPVNNLIFTLTAGGGGVNEDFVITTNGGGMPAISSSYNCFTTITGNTIFSGSGASSNGGGGVFEVTNPSGTFTTLTITGNGGAGGALMALCSTSPGLTCAAATVGGTAAYAGGTVCATSNIGTAMLTGHTGNIVRWETSTNGGSSWSPITVMNTYYNFANAANAQQYRAVVNNGVGCLDENSAVATIATSATNCTATSCDNTTGNVTLSIVTPPSNTATKSVIIFTNASGVIQYASAVDATTVNGIASGDYLVYRVVYDDTQLPLPTLTVGTNITAIGGACAKFTNQLAYKVCVPVAAPDLITKIGQPMPTLSVGQPSNLPITVVNIGNAPAPGIITTTITLPTGVTAPATFTSNSWTCSTTAPTVTCTNPGPINAGRDSTFFVPITPNASLSGTTPTFNATTNPVTGETITNNNAAPPTTTLVPVIGGSLLTMKVLLQGNYDPNTGWMHDSLRKKGLIPLSDPYRTAAYSTKFVHKKNGATQTTTPAILAVTGANAIVDWVFVELHSATNPATVVTTKAALLQRDGDIVSSDDGVSPVLMDSVASGNYYISIRHRNHLGTMTATTRSLSATSTVVDFTTMTAAQLWNKAGGDGYEQTKSGIRNLLWAGDTDGNRQTVFAGPTNDVDPVFFEVMTNVANVNFVPNYILKTVYLASDVNLDGKVIYQSADNEVDIILFMVLSHTLNTGFIPSYIIVEQLP